MTQSYDKKYIVEDRLQTALAMTHHVQNRIIQCMARGSVSRGIADDVRRINERITDAFDRAAKEPIT